MKGAQGNVSSRMGVQGVRGWQQGQAGKLGRATREGSSVLPRDEERDECSWMHALCVSALGTLHTPHLRAPHNVMR